MAQLDDVNKKVLLTDGKKQAFTSSRTVKFLTDSENTQTSSKEVYFRWLSRLVMLCAIISLAFFLSATLVIFRLAPEIMVEPLLIIRQSESEKMVRYEPISPKMQSLRQFTEMYIKQYIILRNTVVNDITEMRLRWGPGGLVHYMSSPRVYADFVGKNSQSVDKMFDKNYSSEVQIDELQKTSESSQAWEVKFTVFNLSQSRTGDGGSLILKTKRYKASITPRFIEQRRFISARLINPLGFTVLKYNQSEIRE